MDNQAKALRSAGLPRPSSTHEAHVLANFEMDEGSEVWICLRRVFSLGAVPSGHREDSEERQGGLARGPSTGAL